MSTQSNSKELPTISTGNGSLGPVGRTLRASAYCCETRVYVSEWRVSKYPLQISNAMTSTVQLPTNHPMCMRTALLELEIYEGIEVTPGKQRQHNDGEDGEPSANRVGGSREGILLVAGFLEQVHEEQRKGEEAKH